MARKPYQDTTVSVASTQQALITLLEKRGIHATRWTTYPDLVRFEFQPKKQGIAYRIEMAVEKGYSARQNEQLRRATFRIVYWYVKSKLEAIDAGLADMEREFLPYMITGPERVFFQEVEDAIKHGDRVLTLGEDSPLLPEGRGTNEQAQIIEATEVREIS